MSSKTIETILGSDLSLRQLPGAIAQSIHQIPVTMSENFNKLSDREKRVAIVHQVSLYGLGELGIGSITKSAQIVKAGATTIATKAAGSIGKAVKTTVQGAKTGETVAVVGIGELKLTPGVHDAAQKIIASKPKISIVTSGEAGAQSGLPNSMFRQGGEASNSGGVRDALKVNNIKEFFGQTSFGRTIEPLLEKTKKLYDGQALYKVTENINGDLKKGYYVYLDALHKDHLEVFNKNGSFVTVLNLDGAENFAKINTALQQGRTIKHLL